jgi:DNA-binding response OmpR family regulator
MKHQQTKILIIEDAMVFREGMVEILEDEGFEVAQASDGYLGVEHAIRMKPDVILCDILMPGISGFDVYKILNTLNEFQESIFIFMSAMSDRSDIRKGLELGCDDYLTKPFSATDLIDCINLRLSKRAAIKERQTRQLSEQKIQIESITSTNTEIVLQLEENKNHLVREVFKSLEIEKTMAILSRKLMKEIENDNLDKVQKQKLVEMKNKIDHGQLFFDNWASFQILFCQVFPNFTTRLITLYPQLNQQDVVFLSALFINLSTTQLTIIFGISTDSLRKKKFRLKQKLGLGTNENLFNFIHDVRLV